MPIIELNGCQHYFEDVGAGEVLVMLHGANGSSQAFGEHYPILTEKFRVIAPDLRSMGKSEHVASMPHDAWVNDLEALLDYLKVDSAHIFGVSLGSRVAMRFGMEHPERCKSIITTATHTYLTEELDRGMNQFGDDGTKLSVEEQAIRLERHGDDWLEAHRNYYNIRNDPELQKYFNLRVANPMHQVVGEFSDPVNRIKCPFLVIESDNLRMGRSVFDHGMELKAEMPDQVRLAIVPSYAPSVRGVSLSGLTTQIINFVNALSGIPVLP
jgi:pimeloyl-ACP methyl ester carboxylesterase